MPTSRKSKPLTGSDHYLQQAEGLLTGLSQQIRASGPPILNRKEQLDQAIDLVLQGMALHDVEQANHALTMGRLSESEHQAKVGQALDRFNNPAGDSKPAENGPTHLIGLDGELIYLGN